MTVSICDYLQSKIKAFIAERNESIRWFSRMSEVEYTTVYRILNGEQKSLSFVNASKILKVTSPDSAVSILADFYPQESAERGSDNKESIADAATESLLTYRVFVFAEGSSREKVLSRFGAVGEKALEQLLKDGVLSEANGILVSNIEGALYPKSSVVKAASKYHFDLVNLDVPGSYIDNARAAVTEEGLKQLYYAAKEYREKAHKIMTDNKGDIVALISVVSGAAE